MGGQNHQPTSSVKLIGPSAWLSQRLGDGFAAVLQSNSELENAIMAAVDHLHVEELAAEVTQTPAEYLDRTVAKLEVSLKQVELIQNGYRHLLSAAAKEGYKGNPLASTIESLGLTQKFEGRLILPTVNASAWNCVESRVATSNILRTLEWEASEFDQLRAPTKDLIGKLLDGKKLLELEGKRAFVEAVEWNKIPLRQSYARVFSLWNHLHAMFLYSALMMTELFYQANGFASLLDETGANADETKRVA